MGLTEAMIKAQSVVYCWYSVTDCVRYGFFLKRALFLPQGGAFGILSPAKSSAFLHRLLGVETSIVFLY